MMLSHINVPSWTPLKVIVWLSGVCDNTDWLLADEILNNAICGKKLLSMTHQDLERIGATKVDLQEHILEAIESLRFYEYNITSGTLQTYILRLACQSRSLQRQLLSQRTPGHVGQLSPNSKNIVLSTEFTDNSLKMKQRVSLDTLASVSTIVTTVKQITDFLNCKPFSKYDDYRSMKSLILALSIELTSTAQRDQFVDRPNDIIEKSSKTLADYCDRIVHGTRDPLLIQPFHLERVQIKKSSNETDLGLVLKMPASDTTHIIYKISPLSPAKKTNKLSVGDEILQFNLPIVGWSAKIVEKLLNLSSAKKTNKLNEGYEILQFNLSIVGWSAKNIEKLLKLLISKKTDKLCEDDENLLFKLSIVGWSAKNVEKLLNLSNEIEDVTLIVKKCPTE